MSSTVASQLTSSLTTTSPPASATSDATTPTFAPPALSSALPDPGSVGAGGQTGPDAGSSSSLYLYTFLATLVLLLAVSATIVFRSMLLRRRQRAAILAAIANGTYVPPSPPSRANQSVFGEKPRMYEVFLDEERARSQKWASLAPVSATLMDPPRRTSPPTIQSTIPNTPSETNPSGGRMRRFLKFTMPGFLRWRHSRPSEAYSSSLESIQLDSHQLTPPQQYADVGLVQVAVLVAMPSTARPGSQFHIPSHPPSHRPLPSFSRDRVRVTTRTLSVSSDDSLKHDKSVASRAGPFEWEDEVPVVEIGVVHVGMGSPLSEQTHEQK